MIKHVNKLKKEKEDILSEVEKEEEYISNTLQKKLQQVLQDKIELENRLEQEQEYIVHKLQNQLISLTNEKRNIIEQLEQSKSQLLTLKSENFLLNQKVRKYYLKLNFIKS